MRNDCNLLQASARFCDSLIKALNGENVTVECTYVMSDICPGVSYFASEVELGKNGVKRIRPVGKVRLVWALLLYVQYGAMWRRTKVLWKFRGNTAWVPYRRGCAFSHIPTP